MKHIGAEYNSVVAADISDVDAGSKKVDLSLGAAYQGLKIGVRTATAIFLYSFSGGNERGISTGEIKRSATTTENPASVVAEAVEQLKGKLFYLQNIGEKYFFTNQPNINRIVLTTMENINDKELIEREKEYLKENLSGGKLKLYLWEENSSIIPDSEELKLIILRREDEAKIKCLIQTKGQTPRVYRNTLFFLYPNEPERGSFLNYLKRKIAYELIEKDKNIKLSDEQKVEIKKELKKLEVAVKETIRKLYGKLAIPDKDGYKELPLGIPTYGEEKGLDIEVYERLHSNGEILESIAPIVIKEKYLSDKEFVFTEQLYQASLKTAGEKRPVSKSVVEKGISEGVGLGIFGLGEFKDGKPLCRFFKEKAPVALSGSEIIIEETLCRSQKERETIAGINTQIYPALGPTMPDNVQIKDGKGVPSVSKRDKIHLKFQIPKGKVSSIMGVINFLQSRFSTVEIELIAEDGELPEQDYEDKILEAFRQLGIKLVEKKQ